MKTIGLIGGMSWESTALYYAAINKEVSRRKGGLHSAPILLHSVDFAPIAEQQANHDWQGSDDSWAIDNLLNVIRLTKKVEDVRDVVKQLANVALEYPVGDPFLLWR